MKLMLCHRLRCNWAKESETRASLGTQSSLHWNLVLAGFFLSKYYVSRDDDDSNACYNLWIEQAVWYFTWTKDLDAEECCWVSEHLVPMWSWVTGGDQSQEPIKGHEWGYFVLLCLPHLPFPPAALAAVCKICTFTTGGALCLHAAEDRVVETSISWWSQKRRSGLHVDLVTKIWQDTKHTMYNFLCV